VGGEMTAAAPGARLSVVQIMVLGLMVSISAIASSWLLAGHNWLGQSGQNERQIAVNTHRLDVVEDKLAKTINETEHEQLIERIMRLESLQMKPCK